MKIRAMTSLPTDWREKPATWWSIGLELLQYDYVSNTDLGERSTLPAYCVPMVISGRTRSFRQGEKAQRSRQPDYRHTEWVGSRGKLRLKSQ